MDWTQILAIIGTNVALFAWLKSDLKDHKQETIADRKDILNLIRSIEKEMKDFHGRLISLEERSRK